MPFHPDIAARLPSLEGIPSFEVALSDPSMTGQLEAFNAYPDAPSPPHVQTRMVFMHPHSH